MKQLQLISLIVCGAILVGCESTETAGQGNQEKKRLAAVEQWQQESAQIDESDRNLWNAQHDILNRDSNPSAPYR